MIYDAATWVLIALAPMLLFAAVAIARARVVFAIAALLAGVLVIVTLILMALDAPDLALAQAAAGVVMLAPLLLGAASLAAKTAAAPKRRWLAPAAGLVLTALMVWAAPDLPPIGQRGGDVSALYINRAIGESGMLNAVTAITANYRAIDTLLAAGAIFLAALGAYGVLGFGERSVLRRPAPEPGEGA